jgi:hypothetical protein
MHAASLQTDYVRGFDLAVGELLVVSVREKRG